jgi:tyrosine-protein phosphatase YwqE
MVQKRIAHVVASDAHDPHDRAPVSIRDIHLLKSLFSEQATHLLLYANPAAIVDNQPVADLPRLRGSWIPSMVGGLISRPFCRNT